ncbi:hypothetical protein HCN44_003773 [Aphidius gifuensis]|uniref:Neural proliferation differentiation and control protein 1 n=1 Tax=Aphidius gifuensis TaxID=684658 RepID=A0A834XM69_APHGI|nr:uncharacterized protein LOC122858691 [Aphidius gifuensis]KAF7987910.1 hypothetical protein HCN44_003773 [Aphidius gifuensis]
MKIIHLTYRFTVILVFLIYNYCVDGLELYQSVESDEPPDQNLRLKQLEDYLESQDQRIKNYPVNSHKHSSIYNNEMLDYRRDEEKNILDLLLENSKILNILNNEKLKNYNRQEKNYKFNNPHLFKNFDNYYQDNYDEQQQKQQENINNYENQKIPFAESQFNEKMFIENYQHYPVRLNLQEWNNIYNENNPINKLKNKILEINSPRFNKLINKISVPENVPEFTYKFDNIIDENSENNFAFKPNDIRYYKNDNINEKIITPTMKIDTKIIDNNDIEKKNIITKKIIKPSTENITVIEAKKIFKNMIDIYGVNNLIPEPQRRASISQSDIGGLLDPKPSFYIIAFFVGCCAIMMFLLVLISLTWCRLERGAKAAADIEYPAYGVTGPNKDISPSGDQRLAHSAQMYHFQHQKQQIIAMEKSVARDPGSVSEAESDEENEEGDYTVYECPGLAPAGEMEVKNPLFHDDPTPATPLQKFHDDDHQHH